MPSLTATQLILSWDSQTQPNSKLTHIKSVVNLILGSGKLQGEQWPLH